MATRSIRWFVTDVNVDMSAAEISVQAKNMLHTRWAKSSYTIYSIYYCNRRSGPSARRPCNSLGRYGFKLSLHNPLTPNDLYKRRTAQLTSRRCLLCIYSTSMRTEYFKHAA